ncbi:metallophosphoesterase family protein [Fusibacter bizertensis]
MKEIIFAVFSDLHFDHIHDGYSRLQKFIDGVKTQNLDFVIQLGDFAYPIDENHFLHEKIKEIGVPFYSVLGNHDTDAYSREIVMKFLGMKNNYYSFSIGKVKFIVLDSCFIKTANGCLPYLKRNYDKLSDNYPYIPNEEIKWLINEFKSDSQYFVIFSHHSLENNFQKRGICNRLEIQEIINDINKTDKRVLLCMNGHDHGEHVEKIGETYYYSLNSMSYIWVGPQYEHFNYPTETHAKYPYLKDLILYEDGLYALVTIFENGDFEIKGMEGAYDNISPQALGIGDTWNGRNITPLVSSIKSKY